MTKRYQDPEWLEQQYWQEGLTQREIAEECGVSTRTIRRYMNRFDIDTRDMEGENHPLYGTERDEDIVAEISETLSGREIPPETRERMSQSHAGTDLPEETKSKISDSLSGVPKSEETRRRMSESREGEDNPNWRGGYTKRYGAGWTDARRRVRERDEVCQRCGAEGTDRSLDVHHIVSVREFREDLQRSLTDAHQLDNLVLLCRQCHMRVEHGDAEVDGPNDDPE